MSLWSLSREGKPGFCGGSQGERRGPPEAMMGDSRPERTLLWDPLGACDPGSVLFPGNTAPEETETSDRQTSAWAPRPPWLQWLG